MDYRNFEGIVNRKTELVFYAIVTFFISIFLIIRAIKVPLAHDEIATFFYFVQNGKINPFFENYDTNNHFLNSFLTWVSYHLFGETPIALRLPNLLFVPVFFYGLFQVMLQLKSTILRFLTFVTIVSSLHFIEFFALSRGYGMSMAMLIISIMHVLKWIKTKRFNHLVLSIISVFIGCLANLALINYYALLLVFIYVTYFYYNKTLKIRELLRLLLISILPFALILAQILYIKFNSGLIAGSPNNFWVTTIRSLFGYMFEINPPFADIIPGAILALIALLLIIYLAKQKNIKGLINSNSIILSFFFIGCISSILFLRFAFGVNYPDDRIGSYLYLFMVLNLVFLFDDITVLYNKNSFLFPSVLLFLLPVHFLMHINTSYSIWYKYDVIPKRFYITVMKDYAKGSVPPTIAAHGMRIFCWSYLSYIGDGNASAIFFTTFPSYNADYQIVNLKMIPYWQKKYDTIDYDAISERHLLKLKYNPTFKPVETIISNRINSSNQEYIVLAEGSCDSLKNKCIQLNFNLEIDAKEKPFNARIVVDISDKNGSSLAYEYIQFNWLRKSWEKSNFTNCILVDYVPESADRFKIYVWNIDKSMVTVAGKIALLQKNTD